MKSACLVSYALHRAGTDFVVLDADGVAQAWGSVHDRAEGRMLLIHVVARDLAPDLAATASRICSVVPTGEVDSRMTVSPVFSTGAIVVAAPRT